MKMNRIFNVNVNVCRFLFLLLLTLNLSGCLTYSLHEMIGDGKRQHTTYSNDEIVGFSKGIDSNKKEGWVFIGRNFDYLLSSGGESIISILNDDTIDKKNLTASAGGSFAITENGSSFTGNIYVEYQSATPIIDTVRNSLKNYGFHCYADNACELVRFLSGNIHKKNTQQDNSKILIFHQPVKIEFYKTKMSISPAAAGVILYPATIAADVITSPLQLIGLPLVGIATLASMKGR
ncbi:hypothetical protein [Citrobacter amalonaticus]|uniref:hypothetical protein n=1 Tax=Citrobacter amalonaticus TaxID=35703 RepID=UPI00300CA2C5